MIHLTILPRTLRLEIKKTSGADPSFRRVQAEGRLRLADALGAPGEIDVAPADDGGPRHRWLTGWVFHSLHSRPGPPILSARTAE